jgi:oxygen-independent coproporphyrinogen-3 oxidase
VEYGRPTLAACAEGKPVTVGSDRAGLYVHVPFCASVCPYCDFAVLVAGDERRGAYLDAIEGEAAMYAESDFVFDTVYLGGGTPSQLEPEQLALILDGLRRRLEVAADARLHLEVNPEDVSVERARAWRELGFSFLSLGVQSLDDDELRFLGRTHSADRAIRAFETLREIGFHTLSIDLIYGLAAQTREGWISRLGEALRLGPDHLSCYQLTVHEGTLFGRRRARGELSEATDGFQAELLLLAHRLLADEGLEGYEVSSFAAGVEHRSRHNCKYWNHEPYLGLGPSAHSFDGGSRWWNSTKLRLWQRAVDRGRRPVAGEERLSRAELAFEAVMLGLRTTDGIDLDAYRRRFGRDLLAVNAVAVDRLVADHRLQVAAGRLRPTISGLAVADSLATQIDTGLPSTPDRG